MEYNKLLFNTRKIRKQIIAMRKEGFSNTQIFETLTPMYNNSTAISSLIVTTPEEKLLNKFKWLSNILLVIVLALIGIYFYGLYQNYNNGFITTTKFIVFTIIQFLMLGIVVYLAIQKKFYDVNFNIFIPLLIFNKYDKWLDAYENLFYIYLLLIAILMICTLYYKYKILPLSYFGQAKKDFEGRYILD